MSKVGCELCSEKSDMDFNSIIAVSEEEAILVKSNICFGCFGRYEDDLALSVAILEKRVQEVEG